MDENQEQLQSLLDGFTYFTPYSVDIFNFTDPDDIEVYMQKFRSLPEQTKRIAFDTSSADFIQENLVPQFNLSPEQGIEVTRVIRDVLLADVFIGNMVLEIQNRLGVDPGTANQIASNIVSGLFAPAIEEIKSIHKNKFGSQQPPAQPQPAPKRTFSNPAANLDINKTNVLDLRNKNQ